MAVLLIISPIAPGPRWRLRPRACSCASSDLPPLSYPGAPARQSLLSRASFLASAVPQSPAWNRAHLPHAVEEPGLSRVNVPLTAPASRIGCSATLTQRQRMPPKAAQQVASASIVCIDESLNSFD